MLELKFHPDVYQELDDAYHWYESKSEGLGEDLLNELDRAFSLIQNSPYTWPILSSNFRRYLLKKFPYGVIYQIKEDCIFVVAIMHLSRKPNYWIERVK